jgi:hypothetical protein
MNILFVYLRVTEKISVTNFVVILDDLGDIKNMRNCSFMDRSERWGRLCAWLAEAEPRANKEQP